MVAADSLMLLMKLACALMRHVWTTVATLRTGTEVLILLNLNLMDAGMMR